MPYAASNRRIIRFPREDAAFSGYLDACLAGVVEPADLTHRLRAWYPEASVHVQEDLGTLGRPVWYAYRDGRIRAEVDARWWEGPEVPCIVFDESGQIVLATPSAERIAGRPAGGLVGLHWSDLVPAALQDDSALWLWEVLRDRGWVQSTARIQPPDGPEVAIEYRSTRVSEDRYRSCWRLVELGSPQMAAAEVEQAETP